MLSICTAGRVMTPEASRVTVGVVAEVEKVARRKYVLPMGRE